MKIWDSVYICLRFTMWKVYTRERWKNKEKIWGMVPSPPEKTADCRKNRWPHLPSKAFVRITRPHIHTHFLSFILIAAPFLLFEMFCHISNKENLDKHVQIWLHQTCFSMNIAQVMSTNAIQCKAELIHLFSFFEMVAMPFPFNCILVFQGKLPRIFPVSSLIYVSFLIPYFNL